MPRFYSPDNIQGHRKGTKVATVVDAYQTFGASGIDPVADNVLAPFAGGAITAATCHGITSITVKNYHASHMVYVTCTNPAGDPLLADADVIQIPGGESVPIDLAGHPGVDRVWVKSVAGGASVGVTITYTEVPQ